MNTAAKKPPISSGSSQQAGHAAEPVTLGQA